MIYGYARVSTDHQSLAAQVERLTGEGCTKVFQETASGSRADRAALKRAIGRLAAGDVLIVTCLGRLARSTRDLLNVLEEITRRGPNFRSRADAWAETTTAHGRLMVTILGWPCRVRARADPDADRGGAEADSRTRRTVGTKTQAHPPSAAGGPGTARGRRELRRDRQELQRQSQHDLTAQRAS